MTESKTATEPTAVTQFKAETESNAALAGDGVTG